MSNLITIFKELLNQCNENITVGSRNFIQRAYRFYKDIQHALVLKRKRKLVALLLLSYRCIVTINVLWLFLTMPWVGLQCVIVVFPDHTYLLFI